jgi:hypothetical protein
MKLLFSILFFFFSIVCLGQTDRDLLLEIIKQQTKLSEQQGKLSEQNSVTNAKIDALQKQMDVRFEAVDKRFEAVDKRFDTQNTFIIGILGLFGVLIAVIVWDRRTVTKPFEVKTDELKQENKELQREIAIIKEKELKMETLFRKLAEIEPRFAEIFKNSGIL